VGSAITYAPGAEENDLAQWASDSIGKNLDEHAEARSDFTSMRAAVALVAPDRRWSVTLRFDHGYLTIHDGMVGIPDVTLCADYETLRGMADIPLSRLGRLPLPPLSSASRTSWRTTVLELVSGELRIYGLFSHPRLVLRLIRLLSRAQPL
jgi:hypothetical protein